MSTAQDRSKSLLSRSSRSARTIYRGVPGGETAAWVHDAAPSLRTIAPLSHAPLAHATIPPIYLPLALAPRYYGTAGLRALGREGGLGGQQALNTGNVVAAQRAPVLARPNYRQCAVVSLLGRPLPPVLGFAPSLRRGRLQRSTTEGGPCRTRLTVPRMNESSRSRQLCSSRRRSGDSPRTNTT